MHYILSFIGHVALFLICTGLSYFKPQKVSYPKAITATLVEVPGKQIRSETRPSRPVPVQKKTVSVRKKRKNVKKKIQKPASTVTPTIVKEKTISSKKPTIGSPIKLDVANFLFPEYLALVQFRIESHWQPPAQTSDALITVVFFKIGKSGKIVQARIEKTSGSFIADQAALRAVLSANPLPPLPEESKLNLLGVHFDFVIEN